MASKYALPVCSVREYDFVDDFDENSFNSTVDCELAEASRAIGLGTVTGLLISLFINVFFGMEFSRIIISSELKLISRKSLLRTIVLLILVLSLPITVLFLLLASVYKVLCAVLIKRKDKYFVGFLDSFDVFWSLEDNATINVVGIIESDSADIVVRKIKEKLLDIFPNDQSEKIFYSRNEDYGFYYWRKHSFVDIDQYVQIIEFPNKLGEFNITDLEKIMTDITNQSLPYDDRGLFQILITKQRIGNNKTERGDYGIVFRIHHSVGDGVALIELLCKALADEMESYPNMFSMPESRNYDSPSALLDMISKLCEIPLCFADTILRKPDDNTLHGPSLLGKKVFKWTESDENIFTMIKEIKENANELHFSNVLAVALCNGLNNYFTKTMAPVPEDVGIVLPVRFPKLAQKHTKSMLKNDFSVTILDLPVKSNNMNAIKQRCEQVRCSKDPLANHYFLKLAGILPKGVLRTLFNSSQATMVFSNMPGPECLNICGGNSLKRLVFFTPHKGNTGLCITALRYGGVLRLAAMADAALVEDSMDLTLILDGMVDEIRRLHTVYVKKYGNRHQQAVKIS